MDGTNTVLIVATWIAGFGAWMWAFQRVRRTEARARAVWDFLMALKEGLHWETETREAREAQRLCLRDLSIPEPQSEPK